MTGAMKEIRVATAKCSRGKEHLSDEWRLREDHTKINGS